VRTEAHAAFTFDSGTHLGGVQTTEGELTTAQAEMWRDAWIKARKAGTVAVLGNGLTYQNEVPDPVKLQLVESRSYNQSVVWTLLGIPQGYMGSSMMGGQSSLSYSNAQDTTRQFIGNALMPVTTQIEDALSELLPNGRNAAEDVRFLFVLPDLTERTPDAPAVEPTPTA
jgi:phage portal protein BeeE